MARFIVTWYENGFKELEFGNFWNADNYAASRSYWFGTATIVDRKNKISWTYQDGKMV